MNMSWKMLALVGAVSSASACGGGNYNAMTVVVDGRAVAFSKGATSTLTTANGITTLTVRATHDVPNTADAGYATTITIEFNSSAVSTLPVGTAITIDGAASGPAPSNPQMQLDPATIAFTPNMAHHASIRRVFVLHSCFCSLFTASWLQTLTGTLTLEASSSGMRGKIQLGLNGTIPYFSFNNTPQTGQITAQFDTTSPGR